MSRFGRLIEFDERSRQFPIRALIPKAAKPRSYTWSCGIVLDQEDYPACTGFALAHEAAARPTVVKGITNNSGIIAYRFAQTLDNVPGEDYEGSTILGAAKAGVKLGWWVEYRFAFGIEDLALAVGYKGPAVVGINMYTGMMKPNAKGIIEPWGQIEGGHAILCNGYSVKTGLFRLHNSWGKGWGINGECFISYDDLGRLLQEDGEACIPVVRAIK